MKHFIVKTVLFVLPFACLILWVESGLRSATTQKFTKTKISYKVKKEYTEENKDSLQLIVLGSSHALYGVNPDLLSLKSVNLAHRIQDPYYDVNVANYYLEKLPKLEKVLISVFFYNWGSEILLTEPARINIYNLYYNIPREDKVYSVIDAPIFEANLALKTGNKDFSSIGRPVLKPRLAVEKKYWSEPFSINEFLHLHEYSQIIALGARYKYTFEARKQLAEFNSVGMSPSGWWSAGSYTREPNWKHAAVGAAEQSKLFSEKVLVKNINYLEGFIQHLLDKGIEPILFQVPVEPRFWKEIFPEIRSVYSKRVNRLVAKNGLRYFDHSQDSCFTSKDYKAPFADHLNSSGANKFTKLLNAEINKKDEINIRKSLCH
ncbi:MAG: hypothetical protein QNL04_00605 [SAR324 cluster bacterium]|nr:hypothetical protein [SAR324 cluster bacterium]